MRKTSFDLIVLDIRLPGIDGFQVLQRLRAQHLGSRVLLLTARGAVDDRVTGLQLGADDYLPKPFAMQELLARVRALGRRYPEEPVMSLRVGDLTLDLATHDSLTGLLNRAAYLEFVRHALDRLRRSSTGVAAVLFVDVDDLKATNDELGHAAPGQGGCPDVEDGAGAGGTLFDGAESRASRCCSCPQAQRRRTTWFRFTRHRYRTDL